MTMRKTLLLLTALASTAVQPWRAYADTAPAGSTPASSSASSSSSVDQQDNNFYWQGTQLYNLGRLGEAFDSFEKAIQRKQNSKEAEAYLLQIRQEIVNNAKRSEKERGAVNLGKNTPDAALSVVYVQPGFVRVTLHAKLLFDENTASLKNGSIDVINHLGDILNSKEGNRVELTFEDDLDVTLQSRNIDAARALVVFALLNYKHISDEQNAS